MMFATSRGTIIVDCGSKVQNSSITNSTIDMNNVPITGHPEPTEPHHVANKSYVDRVSPEFLVNIVSTTYTQAVSIMSGSLMIFVKNVVEGGPSATFMASKSESYMEGSIARLTSSSGNVSLEKLRIKWEPESPIKIRKTGENFDGIYKIKIIGI